MTSRGSAPLSDQNYFTFVPGLWKGKKGPFRTAAVLRSTNFRADNRFDFGDIAMLDVEERQLAPRQLQRGDIVIERSGGGPKQPVGRVAYFDPPDEDVYCTSNFTTVLRVVNRDAFDPTFVSYYLHAAYCAGITDTLQRATTGIRNLDWGEYQRIEIPRPPISYQRAIAALVRRAHDSVAVEDDLIQALTALKHGAMHTLFTRGLRGEPQKETEIGPVPESWDVEPLSQSVEPPQYGYTASASREPLGPRFLRITDIQDGTVDWASVPYCLCDESILNDKGLMDGDIVVARIGGTTGKSFFVQEAPEAVFASYMIRLRAKNSRLLPKYLYHYMQGATYWQHIAENKGGRLKGGVNAPVLLALPLVRPSVEEQGEIVAILDAIDHKINLHRRKRAVLDELFQALLHKLMTGEIRVGDLDLAALKENVAAEVGAG